MSLSYYFVLLPFSYNLWINYNKRGIPLENCQNLLETNRLRVNENLFHFKEIIESFHFCALCIPILKTTRRTHTHHGEIWLTDLQRSPFFLHFIMKKEHLVLPWWGSGLRHYHYWKILEKLWLNAIEKVSLQSSELIWWIIFIIKIEYLNYINNLFNLNVFFLISAIAPLPFPMNSTNTILCFLLLYTLLVVTNIYLKSIYIGYIKSAILGIT